MARLWPRSYPLVEEMIGRGKITEAYYGEQKGIPAEVLNNFMLDLPVQEKVPVEVFNNFILNLLVSGRRDQPEVQESVVADEDWSERVSLYPWQREALNQWQEHRYRGVVEAVTGAGKTRLALAAAEHHLRRRGRVVVIVPTHELLYQWKREAEKMLFGACGMRISLGLLGDKHKDNLRRSHMLFTTVQSARDYRLLPPRENGLLIADEVHRYGGERWSRALSPDFERRLGLTATYEREDRGLERFLDPYFGGKVFSVDYRRALDDGVIAPFKIAFVAVRFSSQERKEYDDSSKRADKYKKRLVSDYGIPNEPFGEFMREVTLLSKSGEEGAKFAGFYLSAFSKRRQILAEAAAKYQRVADLTAAVRKADKTILFAQTKEAASEAAERFTERGVNSAVLNSGMDMSERKEVFAAFEDGKHELVAAPRLLDEGVDVPSADLAIVLASSRSRRQMVQRMGRVVRKKPDGRLARLAVLYVEGTSEDPDLAHEDFLYLVTEVAQDIKRFPSRASATEVCSYLNDWVPC